MCALRSPNLIPPQSPLSECCPAANAAPPKPAMLAVCPLRARFQPCCLPLRQTNRAVRVRIKAARNFSGSPSLPRPVAPLRQGYLKFSASLRHGDEPQTGQAVWSDEPMRWRWPVYPLLCLCILCYWHCELRLNLGVCRGFCLCLAGRGG